jgi:hypothetical protein
MSLSVGVDAVPLEGKLLSVGVDIVPLEGKLLSVGVDGVPQEVMIMEINNKLMRCRRCVDKVSIQKLVYLIALYP